MSSVWDDILADKNEFLIDNYTDYITDCGQIIWDIMQYTAAYLFSQNEKTKYINNPLDNLLKKTNLLYICNDQRIFRFGFDYNKQVWCWSNEFWKPEKFKFKEAFELIIGLVLNYQKNANPINSLINEQDVMSDSSGTKKLAKEFLNQTQKYLTFLGWTWIVREQPFFDNIMLIIAELLPIDQKQYIEHYVEPTVSKTNLEYIYDYLHIKETAPEVISEKEKILAQLYRDVDNKEGKSNPKAQNIRTVFGNNIYNDFYKNAQYFRHGNDTIKQNWDKNSNDEKLEIMNKWFKQYLYVVGFL